MQVFSRLWCLWGIIYQAPEATTLGSVKLLKVGGTQLELSLYTLLFAWGVTEVLRYGMFAIKVFPHLRVLYPHEPPCILFLTCCHH